MSQKPAYIDFRSQRFRAIAFVVGFCIMTVELISGRMMAPYLGSSLYTWTAVLTSVLAAIATGSYFGGKCSTKKGIFSQARTWLFMSSGLLLLTVFVIMKTLGPILEMSDLPISFLTLLFSSVVFFPPAFTLSAILPLLVSADVRRVEESGSQFGSLAAWNAAGSILGTYATGFVFISYLNTEHVLLAVIAVLLLAAIMDGARKRKTSVV